MKVTQHGSNIWKLTRWWVMNAYLVREGGGLTLVDTGMAGSAGGILEAAEEIGLPVTRIMLTHAHADHAGSLEVLRERLIDAEVVVGERSAAFLRGETALQSGEGDAPLRGSFIRVSVTPDRLVGDGDRVGSLRVIATPGHSPDHLAFLDERDGTLIAGDAFQTQGGIAVAGTLRWRFPLPALATWDRGRSLESARRLRALEPARLAVGHGEALERPIVAMDRAIAEAEARLGDGARRVSNRG